MLKYRIRQLTGDWEHRNNQRLPLKDLAAAIGVTPSVLSKMASPEGYNTSSKHIELLCRFFGVTPNELIELQPPIDPNGTRDLSAFHD